MAQTVDQVLVRMLGQQSLTIARLTAENESLREQVATLTSKLTATGDADVARHG